VPESAIEINTLSDVLIRGKLNDLSFIVDNKLMIVTEQQSTINPNMPLRLLFYCARLYEKRTRRKALYSGRRVLIPWPECVVLYNGKEDYPDEQTLRLSDAFEDIALPGLKKEELPLELTVKVYNINEGRDIEPLKRSGTLNQYSAFIALTRQYEAKYPEDKERAMREAIKHSVEHDILKLFLERNAGEVLGMLLEEWDDEVALEVIREEALEAGLEKGLEQGLERGLEKGREETLEEVLNLIRQGYTSEDDIKKKLSENSR
jgi:hypothetical protein